MTEQGSIEINFDDKDKQQIFQMLTSHKRYTAKPFTSQDLKVDLVLRMPLPHLTHNLKSRETPFNHIFKNTPQVYEEMYNLVGDYLEYLVDKNPLIPTQTNPITRTMTSIMQIDPSEIKKVKLDLDLQDPVPSGVGNAMDIECTFSAADEIDTFSLKYNMMMIILQKFCGFKVRTFILQDEHQQVSKEVQRKNLSLYFLLSLSSDNLLKVAQRYRIKKEINMGTLDFQVNDPMDYSNRPIKINSVFKTKEMKGFSQAIKRLNRDLGESNKLLSGQVIEQSQITDARTFQKYFQQLEYEVNRVFPPRELRNKIQLKLTNNGNLKKLSNFSKRQTLYQTIQDRQSFEKRFGEIPYLSLQNLAALKRQGLFYLNKYERQYLFNYNRHKINQGCEQKLLKLKRKKYIFKKIMQLNKKFGYKIFEYQDTFVQFTLPAKHKSFFQKLQHILQYQNYNNSPFGQLSLFTNMERIKLVYLNMQEHIRIDGLERMGIDVYAINNQFQIRGDASLQYDKYDQQNGLDQDSIPIHRPVKQLERAYSWMPFLTDRRAVRDYLGDHFGLELSFRIYLITYLFCLIPIALAAQLAFHYYISSNRTKQYIFSFVQLLILFFSYSVFIQLWEREQKRYFQNYIQIHESMDLRPEYKGPYIRNIVDDNFNSFQTSSSIIHNIRSIIAYGIMLGMFFLCAFYFGLIRKIIVAEYHKFPHLFIFSFSHITFYGVYFISLLIMYEIFIKRVLFRLVQFQNFAKLSEHQDAKRKVQGYFTFSVELIALIFFFILQNFNGTTCYAKNCVIQFEHYVTSRYVLQISINLSRNLYKLFRIKRIEYLKEKYQSTIQDVNEDIKKTFQYKLGKLLTYIQHQHSKQEIIYDVRSQMIVFMFFSIFFIRFPFCQIISAIALFADYEVKKIITLKLNRRPIPDSNHIYRFTPILKQMYYASMIINSFSLIFNDSFLQYDLKNMNGVFVTTMTENNMLTFKLFTAGILFIFFLIMTIIFRKIGALFAKSKELQKRKKHKFQQFKKKSRGKPAEDIVKSQLIPLKVIFRTFATETVKQYKKNKFNFLKKKLKTALAIDLKPSTHPQPAVEDKNVNSGMIKSQKKTLGQTFHNASSGFSFNKKKSKYSPPDNLRTTQFKNIAQQNVESLQNLAKPDYL